MTTPAWHSDVMASAADASYSGGHSTLGTLSAGERISPSSGRSLPGGALRGALLLIVVLGGGWATIGDRAALQDWVQAVTAPASPPPAAPTRLPALSESASALPPLPRSIEPDPEPKLAAVVIPPPPPITPTKTSASAPAPGAAPDADVPEPLPPPKVNPADPYEVRALSVGLHPGLSRVLLTRMSDADYRNARIAIQKAIAETADRGVFVWPRQRKPELALFRISFVPGAAPNCRRYVAVVTKDGWSTTALPMERCGPHIPARRS